MWMRPPGSWPGEGGQLGCLRGLPSTACHLVRMWGRCGQIFHKEAETSGHLKQRQESSPNQFFLCLYSTHRQGFGYPIRAALFSSASLQPQVRALAVLMLDRVSTSMWPCPLVPHLITWHLILPLSRMQFFEFFLPRVLWPWTHGPLPVPSPGSTSQLGMEFLGVEFGVGEKGKPQRGVQKSCRLWSGGSSPGRHSLEAWARSASSEHHGRGQGDEI